MQRTALRLAGLAGGSFAVLVDACRLFAAGDDRTGYIAYAVGFSVVTCIAALATLIAVLTDRIPHARVATRCIGIAVWAWCTLAAVILTTLDPFVPGSPRLADGGTNGYFGVWACYVMGAHCAADPEPGAPKVRAQRAHASSSGRSKSSTRIPPAGGECSSASDDDDGADACIDGDDGVDVDAEVARVRVELQRESPSFRRGVLGVALVATASGALFFQSVVDCVRPSTHNPLYVTCAGDIQFATIGSSCTAALSILQLWRATPAASTGAVVSLFPETPFAVFLLTASAIVWITLTYTSGRYTAAGTGYYASAAAVWAAGAHLVHTVCRGDVPKPVTTRARPAAAAAMTSHVTGSSSAATRSAPRELQTLDPLEGSGAKYHNL